MGGRNICNLRSLTPPPLRWSPARSHVVCWRLASVVVFASTSEPIPPVFSWVEASIVIVKCGIRSQIVEIWNTG